MMECLTLPEWRIIGYPGWYTFKGPIKQGKSVSWLIQYWAGTDQL
jgi:hypothetical protein